MSNIKSWTLAVEEDPETGDSILTFPENLLEITGWQAGDLIKWTPLDDGSYMLSKSKLEVTPEEEEAWQDLELRQRIRDQGR